VQHGLAVEAAVKGGLRELSRAAKGHEGGCQNGVAGVRQRVLLQHDPAARSAPGADVGLTNDGSISGAGQIGTGDRSLALTNQSVIDATGANALTIDTGNSFVNSGTLEAAGGGGLFVADAVTGGGSANILSNSRMTLASSASNSVTFENNSGSSGALILNAAQNFTGTVAGLAQGDTIDLANFLFSGAPTISQITGTGAVGTTTNVTVTDGSQSVVLQLVNATAGEYSTSGSAYSLTPDTNSTPGTLFQLAAHA
jgi:hypothetical protein